MTAEEVLADVTRRGIELVARGDRLRYRPRSAVTPGLLERLRTHKAELLTILGRGGACDGATGPDGWPVDSIDPPPPCPECGGLVFWWNPLGDRRCMSCDPPRRAIRALEQAERIRRRRGKPSPIGAVKMLAELKRLI